MFSDITILRPPRGYGEQGNLPFLLFETWEHEPIFHGNLGTTWILGSNLEFLLREQSKNTFGNKGDFVNFSKEHGNTDTHWGPTILWQADCSKIQFLNIQCISILIQSSKYYFLFNPIPKNLSNSILQFSLSSIFLGRARPLE